MMALYSTWSDILDDPGDFGTFLSLHSLSMLVAALMRKRDGCLATVRWYGGLCDAVRSEEGSQSGSIPPLQCGDMAITETLPSKAHMMS